MNLRKNKSLHQIHAEANAAGDRALNVFHDIAAALDSAASAHSHVADSAQAHIDELTALRDAATAEANRKSVAAMQVVGLIA